MRGINTIHLVADIDLHKEVNGKRVNWIPIGYNDEYPFRSSFVGYIPNNNYTEFTGSHTISGLYIHDEVGFGFDHYGLFGKVEGLVSYLNLENPDIYVLDKKGYHSAGLDWRTVGSVCGTINGYQSKIHYYLFDKPCKHGIFNVSVKNTHTHVVAVGQWMVGGIVGQSQLVGHCNVTGSVYSNVQRVTIGSVAGRLSQNEFYRSSSVDISDCLSNVSVSSRIYGEYNDEERCYMGGIVGSTHWRSDRDGDNQGSNITSCASMGQIYCYHTGVVGGICGKLFSRSKISGCSSTCTIKGGNKVGGIVGAMSKTCYKDDLATTPEASNWSPIVEHNAYSGHIDASNAGYAGGICGYFDYEDEAVTACLFAGTMAKTKDLSHCSATTGYCKDVLSYISMCYYDKVLFDGNPVPNANNNPTVKGLFTSQLISGQQSDVEFIAKPASDAGFTLNEGHYPMPYNTFVLNSSEDSDVLLNAGHGNMVYQPGAWLCSLPLEMEGGDFAYDFVSTAAVPKKETDIQLDNWHLYLKNTCSFPNVSYVKVKDNEVTACGVGECNVTIGCTVTTDETYAWDRPLPIGGTKQLMLNAAFGKIWDGTIASGLDYGTGIAEDPYIIRNGAQLAYAVKNNKKGEFYEQLCDIYLNDNPVEANGDINFDDKRYWMPSISWNAIYDGNSHLIYYPFVSWYDTAGLFGNVSASGVISNLGLIDGVVSDFNSGLMASVMDGKISNCLVKGFMTTRSSSNKCKCQLGGICYIVGKNNPNAVIEDCISAVCCLTNAYADFTPFTNITDQNKGVVRNCLSVMPICFMDHNGNSEGYSTAGHSYIQDCYWLRGYENNDSGFTLEEIGNALSKRKLWMWNKGYFPTLKSFADLDIAKLLTIPIRTDIDYDIDGQKNQLLELRRQVEFEPGNVQWENVSLEVCMDADGDMGIIVPLVSSVNWHTFMPGILRGIMYMKGRLNDATIYIPVRTACENMSKGITFVDSNARQACLEAFDTDGDGNLSLGEIKAVTNAQTLTAFQTSTARKIKQFPEFRYFKSITELTKQLNGLNQLEEVRLPYANKTLGSEAFKGCDKLQNVIIPSKLTTVKPGAFYGSSVDTILVDPFNEKFVQRDGILFNASSDLVAYPNGRSGEEIVVPGVVNTIAEGAVYKVPGARRFYFDTDDFKTVAYLENNGLVADDNTLMDVYISDATKDHCLYDNYLADDSWKSYSSANKLHRYFPLKIDDSVSTMANGNTKYVGDFYIGFDTELPESITPYTVAGTDTISRMAYLYERNQLVPSMTPVVVFADRPGVYRLSPYDEKLTPWLMSENKLIGVDRNGLKLGQMHSDQGNILTPAMNDQGEFAFLYNKEPRIAPFHSYLTFNTIGASAETARYTYYDVDMALKYEGKATDKDFSFNIFHNVANNSYELSLLEYVGTSRNIVVPEKLSYKGMSVPVRKMGPDVFSNVEHDICNIDMSNCYQLEPIRVDREVGTPFGGTNRRTIIYLPDGMNHAAVEGEPNVVIGYECENLVITNGWDFVPPYGFHAQKASYDRTISAVYNGDGTWSRHAYALCLPFEFNIKEQADYDFNNQGVYTLKYVSDDYQFIFDVTAHTLYKGHPYLLVVNQGELNISAEDVDVVAEPDEKDNEVLNWDRTTEEVGRWMGTFRRITPAEAEPMNAYGLQSDGKWKRYRTDFEGYEKTWIGAQRTFCSFYELPGRNVFSTSYGGYLGADEEGGHREPFPADLYDGDSNIPDDEVTDIMPVFRTLDADGTSRYFDLQGRQLKDKPEHGVYITNGQKSLRK